LIIPYIDSIIEYLQVRFSAEKSPAFLLTYFHPSNMKNISLKHGKEVFSLVLIFTIWKESKEKVNYGLKYGIPYRKHQTSSTF